MSNGTSIPFSLIPFGTNNNSSTASNPAITITGTVLRTATTIEVEYHVGVNPQDVIAWPTATSLQPPRRKDGLWKTTCLEFFLSPPAPNSKKYWEINASPSRDWQVYHFDDYREGMAEERRVTAVDIDILDSGTTKRVRAVMDLSELGGGVGPLDMSVTAVIEKKEDGSQTFWALTHTGEEADFHRRDSFILKV